MSTVEQLLNQALKLSYRERAQLAERLWESLHPPGEDISDEEYRKAWAAEIERRLAEADRGEFAEGDWRDVLARARQSLKTEQTS